MKIQAPQLISEQAAAFYAQEMQAFDLLDFKKLPEVQAIRDVVHPIWAELSSQIPYEYAFKPININGINCFQADPPVTANNNLVVLYLHGGSYMAGHPTLCKHIPVSIARESGIRVISIEYRLAPEHEFPAPIEDVLAVINGLKEQFGENVTYALIGFSAGGGLALSSVLQAQIQHIQLPKSLALIAPWIDMTVSGDSFTTLKAFDPSPASHAWFYESVSGFLADFKRDDPVVSPLYGDLSNLCPTYIQLSGRDKLKSEGIQLNRKLLANNRVATLDIWEGMWHGFQMAPLVPEAVEANKATAHFIKSALTQSR